MKKIIFLILLLFYCGFAMPQQEKSSCKENPKILIGLSVGPTIDWFAPTTDAISRKRAKVGLTAGVNADFSVTKKSQLYFSTGVLIRYLQGDLAFPYQYSIFEDDPTPVPYSTVRTYQTTYVSVPTGIKLRTKPLGKCVLLGKLGLYHNFNLGGDRYDSFELPNVVDPQFFVSTKKVKNNDAAFFAESAYLGIGLEYLVGRSRVYANVDYNCQFNYFKNTAINEITDERFKSIVHSLHIVIGFYF